MNRKVTVIIPTTGNNQVLKAINSVLSQSYVNIELFVIIDGEQYHDDFYSLIDSAEIYDERMNVITLTQNVGGNGFYGHRIYAAFTHLINSDYVCYLDQDCWFDHIHVDSLIDTIEKNNLDWSYSLRNIADKDGNFICHDNCESLGKYNPVMEYNHVDTNCYCIKTSVATKVCHVWHNSWGADRIFYKVLTEHFPNSDCSGKYSLNYRVDGNSGSVKPEFFLYWNSKVFDLYKEKMPWSKENIK